MYKVFQDPMIACLDIVEGFGVTVLRWERVIEADQSSVSICRECLKIGRFSPSVVSKNGTARKVEDYWTGRRRFGALVDAGGNNQQCIE